MLVPKTEVDINKQRFKKFKKFSLELFQKQYHIYENEIILTPKPKKTNQRTIANIDKIIADQKKPMKVPASLGVKVEGAESQQPGFGQILNRFDYNYNQSVNLSINERLSFHLNANMQSKGPVGLYTVNPSFSYQMHNTYYRVFFYDLMA